MNLPLLAAPGRRPSSSRRGGVLVKLLFLMIILGAALVLAWMLLLPRGVARVVTDRSAFPTTLHRLAINPFSGTISGGDLRVDNAATLGGGTFLRVASFSGRADFLSVTRSEFVIEELTIDLTQLVIVMAADGRSNAESFGDALWAAAAAEPPLPTYAVAGLPVIGSGPSSVLVRTLHLKIGRLDFSPAGAGPEGRVGEQLDFTATYHNVRRFEDLLSTELILRLAESPALLQALFSSGVLPDPTGAGGAVQELWQKAGRALNSVLQKLDQTGKP